VHAIAELRVRWPQAKGAVPGLIELLADGGPHPRAPDLRISQCAADALIDIDPASAAEIGIRGDANEVPRLMTLLKQQDIRLRHYAVRRLYHLTFVIDVSHAQVAVPILLRVQHDTSRSDLEWDDLTVGELAIKTYERITGSSCPGTLIQTEEVPN
jgi:hypothetical protein